MVETNLRCSNQCPQVNGNETIEFQIQVELRGGGGGSSLFFWTGVSSVTQELFAFTTPVHLQFCHPTYSGYKSVICNQQTNPILCDKSYLEGYEPGLFYLTPFKYRPIIAN